MLAPIPFDAPVTTATFPSSFLLMSSAPPPDSAPCPFRRRACHDGCRAHGRGTAVRPDDGGRVPCPIGRQLRAQAAPHRGSHEALPVGRRHGVLETQSVVISAVTLSDGIVTPRTPADATRRSRIPRRGARPANPASRYASAARARPFCF